MFDIIYEMADIGDHRSGSTILSLFGVAKQFWEVKYCLYKNLLCENGRTICKKINK